MKNMTYAIALSTAIDTMKDVNPEVTERLIALRETIMKRGSRSDEAKAKASEMRKEKTALARRQLVDSVRPIIRDVMHTDSDMTAREIYEAAKDFIPFEFSAPKVQNILLREMASEVVKTERKKGGNLYRLIQK